MSRETINSWLARILRLGLGVVFIWASIPKIAAPAAFLASLYQYELLPPALANVVSVALPWLEFLTGICLLSGVFLPGALACCVVLCCSFLISQASVLYRGMDIDCGCGLLPGSSPITYLTLLRSLFLLVCSLAGYILVWRVVRQTAQTCAKSTEPALAVEAA